MKQRNKKIGEIKDFALVVANSCVDDTTLAELNDEWEDYEEPKEYWCIDWTGGIKHIIVLDGTDEYEENKKQIGNYFETREEAEKAVEKLKAVKRLKDKGFRFDNWKNDNKKYLGDFVIFAHIKDLTDIIVDLDLLFGGDEQCKN